MVDTVWRFFRIPDIPLPTELTGQNHNQESEDDSSLLQTGCTLLHLLENAVRET